MKTANAIDGNDVCFPERARVHSTGVPRPVVDPEGRLWPTIAAAAQAYRLTRSGIVHRIEHTTTGWRWGPRR